MSIRSWTAYAVLFVLCLCLGCGGTEPAAPPVSAGLTLATPVYFPDAGGERREVPAGSYKLSAAPDGLRFVPEAGGSALVVPAERTRHEEALDCALAFTIDEPDDDAHFVLLFLPDGTRVDAAGSLTRERTRGLRRRPAAAKVRARVQAATAKTKAHVDGAVGKVAGHAELLAAWKKDKGQFLRTGFGEALGLMRKEFDGTVGALGKDFLPGAGATRPQPPTLDALLREALRMVQTLAKKRPALKVLLESDALKGYLDGPNPPILRDCKLLISQCEGEARAIFQTKIMPKLIETAASSFKSAAGSALSSALTSDKEDSILLSEEELEALVSGLFTKTIVKQCKAGAARLADLRGADEAGRAKALAALEHALARERRWAGTAEVIYAEVLRSMVHEFIDSRQPWHGGYCLDRAFGMLHLSEGTVEKLVSAIAGLIPEVGAAICAVLEVCIDTAWNMILVPALQREATGYIHELADTAVDVVAKALREKRSAAIASIRKPGARLFAQAVYDLATEGLVEEQLMELLADIDGALDVYNEGVLESARAAGAR